MADAPRSEFRCLAPRPMAATRLLMAPFAGGGVSVLRPLAALLPPSIEPFALQLPGREDLGSRVAFTDWRKMIEDAAGALERTPRGPVALFGCSLGALIALELARRLGAGGARRLIRLFVAARPAPSAKAPDRALIAEGLALGGTELLERMTKAYGAPPASLRDPEIRDYALPILKADLALLSDYRYPGAAGLAAPITVLSGTADPVAAQSDPALWRRETSSEVDCVSVKGGHYFVDGAPAEVAAAIAQRLS